MVRVDFHTAMATVTDGEWASDDAVLLSLLRRLYPLYGFSGAEPDTDLALARYAADLLGGEIVEADKQEFVGGRIY
jgi:hypothetical protein